MSEKNPQNYKVFLTIWFGQLISTLGTGLTNFGIGIYILLHSTQDGTTRFALSALASTLPAVVFGPFAGALVDRWDRRKAMIVSAAGSGVASLGLAVLFMLGRLELWEIYALMALSSAFSTFTWPAISAITSKLLSNKHFGRANAMLQFNEAASAVLTPVIAASVMAAAGTNGLQALVILDVVSFVVAIGALLLAKTPALEIDTTLEHPSILDGAKEGFQFIFARPGLLGLLSYFLVINFTMPVVFVLFTPLLMKYFPLQVVGAVQSLGAIGMIVGTVGVSIWGGPKKRIYGVLGFGGVASAMMCLFGFPPSVIVYVAALALMTLLFPVVNSSSQAIWMRKTPNDMQGRVFAARRVIASFMSPIALGVAGPLADRFFEPAMQPGGFLYANLGHIFGSAPGAGIRLMFVLMGIVSTATAFLWLTNPRIRNVETELPDASGDIEKPVHEPMAPASTVEAMDDLEGAFFEP